MKKAPETDGKTMQKGMTADAFEALLAQNGADLADWPPAERTAEAEAFARSAEGRKRIAAERAFRQRMDSFTVPDDGADAFLGRLMDVPFEHSQTAKGIGLTRLLRSAFDGLGDTRRLFSRTGVMAELAASVMILALGVMIGLRSPAETASELDLSATLFASSDLDFGGQ